MPLPHPLQLALRLLPLLMLLWISAGAATAFPLTPTPPNPDGFVAEGTEWETPYYVRDSGQEGLTVLIVGGQHGNEPAGAYAAEQILNWPVLKGKLIIIPRANKVALAAGSRNFPGLKTEEGGNLNRNFPYPGIRDAARTTLGRSIWDLVQREKPDWILDLHEGFAVNRQNNESVGSSIICVKDRPEYPMMEKALAAVNATIDDPEMKFNMLAKNGPIPQGLARAAIETMGIPAAILETTYTDQKLPLRIRQHRIMVHSILTDLQVIGNGPDYILPPRVETASSEPGVPHPIRVALYDGPGVGGKGPDVLEETLGSQTAHFIVHRISPDDVRHGVLRQFDVAIFPGGSGSKQSAGLGDQGVANVRDFVSGGGGYVGICAGCYLACDGYSWGLKILDARTKSSKWRRGRGEVVLSFSPDSRAQLFPSLGEEVNVLYVNGPVFEPAGSPEIPDFRTLALFQTELADNDTPPGIMAGSPAIVSGEFGDGRVVGISPHPEQTSGLEHIVPEMVKWSVGLSGTLSPDTNPPKNQSQP